MIEPYSRLPEDGLRRALTVVADDFEIYNGNMVRFTLGEVCVAMFNLDHVGFHYVGDYHDPLEVPAEPVAEFEE